jgi:(p)ppGpp synthase/HD superfamily hydrolase
MRTDLKAAKYAEAKHAGQKRRNGEPYFSHVEAVATIVRDSWLESTNEYDIVAAAYLHDVIEDCGVTKQGLIEEGFPVMVAEIVDALSRKPGETYFDFIMRLHHMYDTSSSGPLREGIIEVKLADLQHNMSDLKEGSLKDKYRFAKYILTQPLINYGL